MDKVNFNPFSEILVEDFLRQSDYIGDAFELFIADFLCQNTAVLGLDVTAQAVSNMTVYVKPGRIYQAGLQGQLLSNLDPALVITAAHPTYARIDRICAQYRELPDTPETRNVMIDTVSRQVTQKTVMTRVAGTIDFMVVPGVAAPGPAAPTVPDGWTSLAQVNVRANTTSVLQTDIVDERSILKSLATHGHSGGIDGAQINYSSLLNKPESSLPLTGGSLSGVLNEAKGANIASAATTNIGAATGNFVQVTGTTTITSLGTAQAGARRTVQFTGTLTLTYNATSLILPGATNLVVNTGDICIFVSLGGGNWILITYEPATTMSMQNQKIVNLLAGVNAGDAVNMAQLVSVVSSGTGWIKFSDGTMIQTIMSGGVTIPAVSIASYSFPLSFYNINYVCSLMFSNQASNSAGSYQLQSRSKYVGQISIYNPNSGACDFELTAIGRWKA